jgi:hypothetical protein
VTSTLQAKRDELAKDPNAASAAEIKRAMDRHEDTIRANRVRACGCLVGWLRGERLLALSLTADAYCSVGHGIGETTLQESVKEAAAKAKAASSLRGKQSAAASRTRGPLDGFLNKDNDTQATQSQRTSAARKAKAPAKPKR